MISDFQRWVARVFHERPEAAGSSPANDGCSRSALRPELRTCLATPLAAAGVLDYPARTWRASRAMTLACARSG